MFKAVNAAPPHSCPLPAICFCCYRIPPPVSKTSLSAQIPGPSRASHHSFKAHFGRGLAPEAAFGIKTCENVLEAAICELVELRAPIPAPAPQAQLWGRRQGCGIWLK